MDKKMISFSVEVSKRFNESFMDLVNCWAEMNDESNSKAVTFFMDEPAPTSPRRFLSWAELMKERNENVSQN